MAKYEIKQTKSPNDHLGPYFITQDGKSFCFRMTEQDAELNLSALQLLDSLTPPKDIEAADVLIAAKEAKVGKWYRHAGHWWRCESKDVERDVFFVTLIDGQLVCTRLYGPSAQICAARSAQTTVGELERGEMAEIGLPAARIPKNHYLVTNYYHYGDRLCVLENGITHSFRPDTPCTRIPDENVSRDNSSEGTVTQ